MQLNLIFYNLLLFIITYCCLLVDVSYAERSLLKTNSIPVLVAHFVLDDIVLFQGIPLNPTDQGIVIILRTTNFLLPLCAEFA